MQITTCQICGRAIKSAKGLIAHHGYTRKGGWQTSSCFGARYRPYEVACDAIQRAIDKATAFQAQRTTWLAEHVANPPATITYDKGRGRSWNRVEMVTVERPEGFDYATHCRGAYNPSREMYAMQYAQMKHAAEQTIKQVAVRSDIGDMSDMNSDSLPPKLSAGPPESELMSLMSPMSLPHGACVRLRDTIGNRSTV